MKTLGVPGPDSSGEFVLWKHRREMLPGPAEWSDLSLKSYILGLIWHYLIREEFLPKGDAKGSLVSSTNMS